MRTLRLSLALLLVVAFAGCPDKQEPAPDAATAEAEKPDAGEPPPPELVFTLQAPLLDGGTAIVPIGSGTQPELEQASSLEISSNLPVENYRIRVFDEVDRAMVSDDVAEETAAGLRYQIAFPTPLKTGHEYTVIISPQTGPAFTDSLGRTYTELRQTFRIAGEKEKPKPTRRRRRR